jgi:anti-sigma B factor antagonist
MEYTVERTEQSTTFSLKGNLIIERDGMSLAEELNTSLEAGERNFVVDLFELEHLNSVGVGILITLLTRSRRVGGELVLSRPSAFIRNLLMITKLNQVFKVYDNLEDAQNANFAG